MIRALLSIYLAFLWLVFSGDIRIKFALCLSVTLQGDENSFKCVFYFYAKIISSNLYRGGYKTQPIETMPRY
jgi:hypothetical protein